MSINSLKISDATKKAFFGKKFFEIDQKNDKTTAVQILAVFRYL